MGGGMAYQTIGHGGLGRFRRFDTDSKAASSLQTLWDRQWRRRQAVEAGAGTGVRAIKLLRAEEMSEEADAARASLTSILLEAVRQPATIDWSSCLDRRAFNEPPPQPPAKLTIAREPQAMDAKFVPPKQGLLTRWLHPSRAKAELEAAKSAFVVAHEDWKTTVQWHMRSHATASTRYQAALSEWDARKSAYYAAQEKANARLETLRLRYREQELGAVAAACDLMLLNAPRPEGFPAFWRIAFHPAGGLKIDYELPAPDALPALRRVKYDAVNDAFEGVGFSEGDAAALYQEALYQTALATIHLLFAADPGDAVRSIAFNGWVNAVDRMAVCPVRACVMALKVDKAAFRNLDLTAVDPRTCFRRLGGAAGAQLADLEAVEPVCVG